MHATYRAERGTRREDEINEIEGKRDGRREKDKERGEEERDLTTVRDEVRTRDVDCCSHNHTADEELETENSNI